MTLETAQDVDVSSSGITPRVSQLGDKPRTPDSGQPGSLNSHHLVTDHVNEVAHAAAYQEHTMSPSTVKAQKNESRQPGIDPPAVEESVDARLERLGRQRPEVFESIWAEIGFVFSISMSQVLSVS